MRHGAHCGVRRNACCVPFTVPTPTICPATLIAAASSNSQPELAGIRALRSRIPLFAVQTNACDPEPVQLPFPTTVPRTLIANALLQVPPARKELKEVGWTKGVELAKLARRDRQHFDCAIWLHKAREMPTEQFKQEVEKELTGRETEPSEIVYFKLYKSQIPVVEQAIETAALMLGSNKSRGYCLEMICADFLAGANLENENPNILLQSALRFFKFLPGEEKQTFLHYVTEKAS